MDKFTKIPISILEEISTFYNISNPFYFSVRGTNDILYLKSQVFPDDFYFKIVGYREIAGILQINVELSPTRTIDVAKTTWYPLDKIYVAVDTWQLLLERYEKINPVFKDPIIETFQNEYFSQFEFVDDDDSKSSLAIHQILELDDYLDKTKIFLSNQQNQENKLEIGKIVKEIELLQGKLTSESKGEIAKAISYVWARITKLGAPILKALLKDLSIALLVDIIKDNKQNLIDAIKKL